MPKTPRTLEFPPESYLEQNKHRPYDLVVLEWQTQRDLADRAARAAARQARLDAALAAAHNLIAKHEGRAIPFPTQVVQVRGRGAKTRKALTPEQKAAKRAAFWRWKKAQGGR